MGYVKRGGWGGKRQPKAGAPRCRLCGLEGHDARAHGRPMGYVEREGDVIRLRCDRCGIRIAGTMLDAQQVDDFVRTHRHRPPRRQRQPRRSAQLPLLAFTGR